jgi:hypothetical protein
MRGAEEPLMVQVYAERSATVMTVVDMYVASRRRSERPVSTGDAIRAIRTALPDCKMADRELSDMVARCAITNGHDVIFDPPDDATFLSFLKS